MKQSSLGLNLSTKKTRKRRFLEEMDKVVPWEVLMQIVEPHYPKAKTGRPPFGIQTMLRIHYLQQWFGLSDPAMEEALHDTPLYREFAQLDGSMKRLPDETTILRFRHLLERHELAPDMLRVVNDLLVHKGLLLKAGTAVDATLIHAPSSTKNASGERDPESTRPRRATRVGPGDTGPFDRSVCGRRIVLLFETPGYRSYKASPRVLCYANSAAADRNPNEVIAKFSR